VTVFIDAIPLRCRKNVGNIRKKSVFTQSLLLGYVTAARLCASELEHGIR